MADNKLQGFGTQALGFGQGADFKKIGGSDKSLPSKDVRPVGGKAGGETGGTGPAKGPATMDKCGGDGLGGKGGKGPTTMPKHGETAKLKQVGGGKLGGADTREMP